MNAFYQDNLVTHYKGDARHMTELPDGSVQCVVTSPPYWGLRKYAGEQELVWGGDPECRHQWGALIPHPMSKSGKHGPASNIGAKDAQHAVRKESNMGNFCSLCGAWKGAYGLEPTPEMYIEHTIQFLREIRKVLRKDGVVFWNIGDSYWGGGQGGNTWGGAKEILGVEDYGHTAKGRHSTLKPKDLCLIPFRVAIAAQEDGWWVRSDIIWWKDNPMPESVNGWRWERHRIRVNERSERVTKGGRLVDCPGCEQCQPTSGLVLRRGSWRPTEAHEFILMLAKSDNYYCDAEAVRESYTEPLNRWGGDTLKRETQKTAAFKDEVLHLSPTSAFRAGNPIRPNPSGRNLRSVWEFPTRSYPGAHFAVFPEKLPEICIKAATPEVGCCSKCGAPWARIISKEEYKKHESERQTKAVRGVRADRSKHSPPVETRTTGWRPTCDCGADKAPSLVLDPFAGAGTTLLVAKKLGRRAVGYEISEEYCAMTRERVKRVEYQPGLELKT